ncbi:MAG: hypothetical protein ACO3WU_13030 [Ilumatobacteraceae bacterium]
MTCTACGRPTEPDDRFCTGCGRPLAAPTESGRYDVSSTGELTRTALVEHTLPDAGWDLGDPVWAATGAVPIVGDDAPTGLVPTAASGVGPSPTDTSRTDAIPTDAIPTGLIPTGPVTTELRPARMRTSGRRSLRLTPTAALGVIGGLVLLVAMFATVVEVVADIPLTVPADAPVGFRLGTWIADDFGSNLSVAGVVAAITMVLGATAASFGLRWGAGLVGGGGLAAAGVAALTIGFAHVPMEAAQDFAAIPSEVAFTLTITKALGYWLLVTAGAVGVIAFFASTNDALGDRFGGLDPWTAALGALAVSVAAVGPLLPESPAVLSDNWFVIDRPGESPAMLVAMRLVQLGLLAVGGIVGFLSVRRWGIGVAAGAALPSVWLGASTLFELGNSPVGPGFRNPGTTDATLHGVTVIGLASTVAMVVLASIAAFERATRH